MASGNWRAICAGALGLLMLGGCASDADKEAALDALARPEVSRSLMDAAATAKAQNDPVTASNYYRTIYSRDPKNIDAATGLLETLRAIGSVDEAREVAKKALATKPDDANLLAEIGKLRLVTGQLEDAVKTLKRAAELDAKNWKTLSALGLAYDRLGNFASADEAYEAALKVSPDNPAVLNNYGLSRAMAHDIKAARVLLERAAAAANSDVRMRQNLALIYALSGDLDQAVALTKSDLPPAMASETVDYYRVLATAAQQAQ
jgi:Flp pilus assembly protein TadD